jgi:hypothetical protein
MDLLPIRRFLDLALPYRVILSTDNGLLEEMVDHRQQVNNNQQKRLDKRFSTIIALL